jgi:hypothetical protein
VREQRRSREMKHVCCNCEVDFDEVPYGSAGINIVVESDDFEIRWDLKDMVRKSDRVRVLNVEDPIEDEVILCVDCYDRIVEQIISRIKRDVKFGEV